MREIWKTTQISIRQFDSSYVVKSNTLLIGLWWTLFIISNFIGRYILKTVFKNDTIEQVIAGSEATLISDMLQIPEAILVVLIVQNISKMESKLIEEVEKIGGNCIDK